MARITIVLPEPKQQYSAEDQRQILQALRTLQQQLNFSFETDIKNDINAFNKCNFYFKTNQSRQL